MKKIEKKKIANVYNPMRWYTLHTQWSLAWSFIIIFGYFCIIRTTWYPFSACYRRDFFSLHSSLARIYANAILPHIIISQMLSGYVEKRRSKQQQQWQPQQKRALADYVARVREWIYIHRDCTVLTYFDPAIFKHRRYLFRRKRAYFFIWFCRFFVSPTCFTLKSTRKKNYIAVPLRAVLIVGGVVEQNTKIYV